MYPYRMDVKDKLSEEDLQKQLAFAQWFIGKPIRFTEQIVIEDGAAFAMNGLVNMQINKPITYF